MSELMVEVEEVSIRFNLEKERVNSIKEYILRRMKGKIEYDEFWALKNVSFQIEKEILLGWWV